jgi:mono/diheme cytochrome c family protein
LGQVLGQAVLVALLAGAAWTPGGVAVAEEGDPRIEAGKQTYYRYCASCHGISGKGDGPIAPDLRVKATDLTTIAARRDGVFPDAQIVEFIDGRRVARTHGPRDMPVWGRQFGQATASADAPGTDTGVKGDLMLLVEYLKSIQVKD